KRLRDLAQRAHGDEVAKIRELEGLAAVRSGEKDEAVKIWSDVVRDQPLSWAALMARSRLASVGAPIPPLLEPAIQGDTMPFTPRLPALPALLASVGLDLDAETYLASDEHSAASPYLGREGEALCRMYGMLSSAKRRYKVGANAVGYSTLMRTPSDSE